jgi:diaminopimelate epimerase
VDVIRAHGTGNDFVVLVDGDGTRTLSSDLAVALCDRRSGIGADGAIRIAAAPDGGVVMDHRNADGSTAAMCGNGARVTALVALRAGLVPPDAGRVEVVSRSGPRPVTVVRTAEGSPVAFRVAMGPALRDPAAVPFDPAFGRTDLGGRWHLDEVPVAFDVVGMGNPHAVVAVDDVAGAPLAELGGDLQAHPAFPDGVNVGMVAVRTRDRVALRVLERGVGETAACGTGACAAVASLHARGLVDDRVAVELPGGTLIIEVAPDGLVLEGPAEVVGTVRLDPGWTARVPAAAAGGWTARG